MRPRRQLCSIRVPAAGAVAAVDGDDRRQAPTVRASTARSGEAKAGKVVAKASPAKAASKASAKASPQAAWRSHRVQRGQTLSSIAAKYNTSVDALRRLNGMRSSGDLQAGATLKVPL